MTLLHMQIFAFAKVIGMTYCVHAETFMNFTCLPKNSCKSTMTYRLHSYLKQHPSMASPKTVSCTMTLAWVRQPFQERDLHDITGFDE